MLGIAANDPVRNNAPARVRKNFLIDLLLSPPFTAMMRPIALNLRRVGSLQAFRVLDNDPGRAYFHRALVIFDVRR